MARALESWIAEHDRAERLRTHRGSQEAARLRDEAWRRFVELGFPTTRDEDWRFTSVAPIAEGAFALAAPDPSLRPADVDSFRLPGAAAELVFADGHYVGSLSTPLTLASGVEVGSLASVLGNDLAGRAASPGRHAAYRDKPFVALNAAFFDDGGAITLRAGAVLDRPIHLLFLAGGRAEGRATMAHPRVVIALGEHSRASVVETYAGPAEASYFTNAVTEIVLDEHSVLDHYRVQLEGAHAYHVGAVRVEALRGAGYTSHAISLGGALARTDLTAVLDGEGVECTLNGLYASDGARLVDNHTTIDHARPHCGSREVYKGILAERARGVFNGKIIVRPDAQQTDAKQTNRALLLSEDARINTKPELEIFANDVKCTHGAAVGQLDDEALFYLRSRGLGDLAARRLLIHAFAGDVLNRMPLAAVRAAVEERFHRQLARALPRAA